MINNDQAIEIIHASSLTQRDTLLVLLATAPDVGHLPAALKELGKKAGVKGIYRWNVSEILGHSKGQSVQNGQGWSITIRGKNRVADIAQSAGITIGTALVAPARPVNSATSGTISATSGRVFIGHGGSPAWKDLREFLENKLHLPHDEFKRIATAGMTNVERLDQMLRDSVFAFIVLTAEDEQKDGKVRARQNVVHEVGLFQGRHGFKRAIVLLEEGCDEFSNIQGLTQIRFPKGKIMSAAEEIRDVLARESVLP
jgi:predicted nucleotide-binding protein